MNPSVQDRLASVVRALTGVVLPALPDEASLAKEQTMLAIGHIQIILALYDAAPAFEAEEVSDLRAMADALSSAAHGGPMTQQALTKVREQRSSIQALLPHYETKQLQDAIDDLLIALAADGTLEAHAAVQTIVLEQGASRALKDRQWFAAMGFDSDFSGG